MDADAIVRRLAERIAEKIVGHYDIVLLRRACSQAEVGEIVERQLAPVRELLEAASMYFAIDGPDRTYVERAPVHMAIGAALTKLDAEGEERC